MNKVTAEYQYGDATISTGNDPKSNKRLQTVLNTCVSEVSDLKTFK